MEATRKLSFLDETESLFIALPRSDSLTGLHKQWNTEIINWRKKIAESLDGINVVIDSSYGIDSGALRTAIELGTDEDQDADESEGDEDDQPSFEEGIEIDTVAEALFSYCVGLLTG